MKFCGIIKIFEKETYRNDFLNGSLYMNRLKFFQKMENCEINDRGDEYEAVSQWYQPNKDVSIIVNGHKILPKDIVGPIRIRHNGFDDLNVFCLSAIYSNGFPKITEENLDEFRRSLMFDNKIFALGDYCITIIDPLAFFKKIDSALRSKNLIIWQRNFVEYFDPNVFHGKFSENDIVFKKRIQFSYQKEYRIVINSKLSGDDPYILEIGDIRDICKVCKTIDINKHIEVKLGTKE